MAKPFKIGLAHHPFLNCLGSNSLGTMTQKYSSKLPYELGGWFRQQLWESLSLPNHAAPQLKPMKANIVEEILKINL